MLLAARRRDGAGARDLFTEILSGRSARPLPESVLRALEELDRRPGDPGGVPARFGQSAASGVAVLGASCSPDEPAPPSSSGHGVASPSRSGAL